MDKVIGHSGASHNRGTTLNTTKIAPYKNDALLFRRIKKLDSRGRQTMLAYRANQEHSGVNTEQLSSIKTTRTSVITAHKAQTRPKTVEKVRAIIDHGTGELQCQLDSGLISIETAYRKALALRDLNRRSKNLTTFETNELDAALLGFLRKTIALNNLHRTWTQTDYEIFHDLVNYLYSSKLLSSNAHELISHHILAKTSNFGGALNGKSVF